MNSISFKPSPQVTDTPAVNTNYAEHNSRKVTVASLNIDTNLMLETKYNQIFPEYTVNNRMSGIKIKLNQLKNQEADIICIQEGRSCTEGNIKIDSVTPVINYLENNNYNTAKIHYNNSGEKAFQFITALENTKFEIIANQRILLSKDGKDYPNINELSVTERKKQEKSIKEHYLDQTFGRSFLLTEAKDLTTGTQMFIANIHLGVFPETHKNKAITHTIKHLTELHNNNPDSAIILAGDFNSFPDAQGAEQIKMLTDANFIELSATVVHPNGEKFIGNSSFIAFPYDYAAYNGDTTVKENINQAKQNLQEEKLTEARNKLTETFQMVTNQAEEIWQKEKNPTNCKSLYPLGGQLDHIFIMAKENSFTTTAKAVLQLMDFKGNTLSDNKDEIVEHMKTSLKTNTPPFATDHQGLLATIRLR